MIFIYKIIVANTSSTVFATLTTFYVGVCLVSIILYLPKLIFSGDLTCLLYCLLQNSFSHFTTFEDVQKKSAEMPPLIYLYILSCIINKPLWILLQNIFFFQVKHIFEKWTVLSSEFNLFFFFFFFFQC